MVEGIVGPRRFATPGGCRHELVTSGALVGESESMRTGSTEKEKGRSRIFDKRLLPRANHAESVYTKRSADVVSPHRTEFDFLVAPFDRGQQAERNDARDGAQE